MATRFSELKFEPRDDNGVSLGVLARTFFPNGYGASVIQSRFSYGGDKGLYELAVLRGAEGSFGLCYTTPITPDVEGNLSPEDVSRLLQTIADLPAAENVTASAP